MMGNNFAAHLDMLGFGNAVCRNFQEAWGALSDLKNAMDKALRLVIIPKSSGVPIGKRIGAKFFSDSIVLYTKNETDEDLFSILISSAQLFANALKSCLPLRGGIAHGKFCMDPNNDLFMGQSLVKAHAIGEDAQWSGIVVDKTIAERSQKTVLKGYIVTWTVSGKDGNNKSRRVLNWPKAFASGFKQKPPISVIDYYKAFEPLFGSYDSLTPDVRLKYENTVKFVNSHLPKV